MKFRNGPKSHVSFDVRGLGGPQFAANFGEMLYGRVPAKKRKWIADMCSLATELKTTGAEFKDVTFDA